MVALLDKGTGLVILHTCRRTAIFQLFSLHIRMVATALRSAGMARCDNIVFDYILFQFSAMHVTW